ncbi:MAG: GNAT family N-acetyltransferase [Oscillatoria sp. SIO1A7]|nr:GNAT family N-acetyltransferase [Oscillatoria sp. SIO1A7]
MVEIVKRKLSQQEAELLVAEIQQTPYIVGYSVREWLAADRILVAEGGDRSLMGVCFSYDFSPNWTKIAVLFVRDQFRGRGIGKRLFYRAVREIAARKKNAYTISANPIVIEMMEQLGFSLFGSLLRLPENCQSDALLFYRHSLQWLLNPYRIRELLRKTIVYRSQPPFIFGVYYSGKQSAISGQL